MKLQRLRLLRMPGFEMGGPSLDELAPGLNLVLGPNGSGKTTAASAIRGLLWPGTLADAHPVEVHGRFDLDGETLQVELSNGRRLCQIDGLERDLPELPPEHLAGCFTISVDDLFAGSRTDRALAQRIALEMSGGYDLNALRQLEPFKLGPRHGKHEARTLREADQRVQTLQAEQRVLLEQSEGLQALRERKTAAATARDSLPRLQTALELCAARARLAQARTLLGEFPEGLDRLKGEEADRLVQLDADRADARASLEAAQRRHDAAGAEVADCGLPEPGPASAELRVQRARVEEAQTLTASRVSLEQEVEGLRARSEEAARRLGAVDAARAEGLSDAELGALDALYERTVQNSQREEAVRQALLRLEAPAPDLPVEALEQAAQILREWLRCPVAAGPSPAALRLAWVACVLVVIGAVGLGVAVSLLALLLLVPALFIGVAIRWVGSGPSVDERRAIEQRFTAPGGPGSQGVAPPGAWSADAAQARLAALEREIAAGRLNAEKRAQRQPLEGEAEALAAEARSIVDEWAELRGRLGLSEEASPISRMHVAERLAAFHRARDEQVELAARVEALAVQERGRLDEARAFLVGQGLAEPADAAEARALTDELVQRVERRADARARIADAAEAIARAEARLGELDEREQQIFRAAGLPDGERDELEARLARLEAYSAAAAELAEARLAAGALQERLGDVDDLGELTEERLVWLRGEAEARAAGYEDLVDRIKDIELKADAAGQARALEQALEQRAVAREQLSARLDEALLAAAGELLLEEVEQEHEQQARPEGLEQAGRLFAAFTLGRYELKLDPQDEGGEAAFRAIDRTSGRGFGLEQLSRGTRMQLLLAARIAFALRHEGPHPLPLLLDEALSSTDPERYRAVVQSLVTLARQGRQVIYFTCQPADARAWEVLCGAGDGVTPVRRIELASWSDGEPAGPPLPELSAILVPPVPEPGGMGLAEYAELVGADAFDPAAPLGAMHLAHVVDDAEQLCRLLTLGIRTWGQVHTLAQQNGIQHYLPADALARLSARAELLHALGETWRIGRGRPVWRDTLEQAGVSDSWIDRVSELAEALDGDAAALVEALREREDERAKGFRSAALDALEAFLADQRYLDPRPRIAAEQAWARVLAAVGPLLREGRLTESEARERFLRYWPD